MFDSVQLIDTDVSGDPASTSQGYVVSSANPSISGDGTLAAFESDATNLVPQSTTEGGAPSDQVYVKDLETGAVILASSTSAGAAVSDGEESEITEDGSTVVFRGKDFADYPGEASVGYEIFAKDLATGSLTLVSQTASGMEADDTHGGVDDFSASSNGNLIAFSTDAPDMAGSAYGAGYLTQVYLKNVATGALTTVSDTASGVFANNFADDPEVSGDGSTVVFASTASNLAAGVSYGTPEIYSKDMATGAVTLVSATADGTPLGVTMASSGTDVGPGQASISTDGTMVEFTAPAAIGDALAIYVKNLVTGALTELPSPDGATSPTATISPDGKYVLYDGNGDGEQVHLINIATGQSTTVTQNGAAGSTASSSVMSYGYDLSVADTTAVFQSASPALAPASLLLPDGVVASNSVFTAQVTPPTITTIDLDNGGYSLTASSGLVDIVGSGGPDFIGTADAAGTGTVLVDLKDGDVTKGGQLDADLSGIQGVQLGPDPSVVLGLSSGTDLLYGGTGADQFYNEGGTDYIQGSTGSNAVVGGSGTSIFYGTGGNDTMYGGPGGNFMQAGPTASSQDVFYGNGGQDFVYGGPGATLVYGGSGTEDLTGGSGFNELIASNQSTSALNVLNGGSGIDEFYAGVGTNLLYEATGTDIFAGNAGTDYVYGGSGKSFVYGGTGTDVVTTGAGDQYVKAGSGFTYFNDTLGNITAGRFDEIDNFAGGKGTNLYLPGAVQGQTSFVQQQGGTAVLTQVTGGTAEIFAAGATAATVQAQTHFTL